MIVQEKNTIHNLFIILLLMKHVISFDDIKKHKNFHLLPNDVCGENDANRIVGGKATKLGEYPWMTRIGYKIKGCGDETDFRCAGSLITTRIVITAAHCIHALPQSFCKSTPTSGQTYVNIVRLGEHNITKNPDCYANGKCADPVQDIEVISVLAHPEYNKPKLRNDIAIIILRNPAKFNIWVTPLCMIYGANTNKNYVNTTGFVAGWGITNPQTRATSDQLTQITVPILELEKCVVHYKHLVTLSKEHQLCAGGNKGEDSCGGDSGGPLFIIDDTDKGPKYNFLGVVSFGFKRCAAKPIPAIYTNILHYGQWIMDNLDQRGQENNGKSNMNNLDNRKSSERKNLLKHSNENNKSKIDTRISENNEKLLTDKPHIKNNDRTLNNIDTLTKIYEKLFTDYLYSLIHQNNRNSNMNNDENDGKLMLDNQPNQNDRKLVTNNYDSHINENEEKWFVDNLDSQNNQNNRKVVTNNYDPHINENNEKWFVDNQPNQNYRKRNNIDTPINQNNKNLIMNNDENNAKWHVDNSRTNQNDKKGNINNYDQRGNENYVKWFIDSSDARNNQNNRNWNMNDNENNGKWFVDNSRINQNDRKLTMNNYDPPIKENKGKWFVDNLNSGINENNRKWIMNNDENNRKWIMNNDENNGKQFTDNLQSHINQNGNKLLKKNWYIRIWIPVCCSCN